MKFISILGVPVDPQVFCFSTLYPALGGPGREDQWKADVAPRSAGLSPDFSKLGQCEDKIIASVKPQSTGKRKTEVIVFSGRQGPKCEYLMFSK